MQSKKEFLDVDFIGGLGSLTKEDEQKLSEYFKNKKKTQLEKLRIKNSSKSKREKV